MALNKNVKKWVKALRSGKYKQGKGRLYDAIDNTYCCLGVAQAEIGSKEGLTCRYLPIETQKRLGLADNAGSFTRDSRTESLAFLNDNAEYTFDDIANLIEKQPEGLFRVSDSLPTPGS